MTIEDKLSVLSRIGRALNDAGVVWAVGASLMLYLCGKADDFHDIDLTTTVEDAPRARAILSRFGVLSPPRPNDGYGTKVFDEYIVDGVEIDVMAGFVILSGGKAWERPFSERSIASFVQVNGVSIPLQSMADWRRNYELMGRMDKVRLIDG